MEYGPYTMPYDTGYISHSMELLTPSSPGGLPTSSLTTPGYLGGGLPFLSSALRCQCPSRPTWLALPYFSISVLFDTIGWVTGMAFGL